LGERGAGGVISRNYPSAGRWTASNPYD
jgi:hypothetical protein